jgi:type VI protein secretion system component VasA
MVRAGRLIVCQSAWRRRISHMNKSLLLLVAAVASLALAGAAAAQSKSVLVIKIGQSRTYAASRLHTGTTIKCAYRGQTLTLTVPSKPFLGEGTVSNGSMKVRFNLGITRTKSGAYYVSCAHGGHHL